MYLQQGTDVSSTEDIPERIKHLSINDSYMTDWRSDTTSTTSSDSGKGGFDGNKPLQLLNAFLEECGTRKIESRQIEWSTCATRTKRKYIQQTSDVLVAVLKVVSPENTGYLWSAVQASKAVNDELGVEGILLPSQSVYLEAIAETYKNAVGWDTRRLILSIMTGIASLPAIQRHIPGLTPYRYTIANMHRLQHGRGTAVPTLQTGRLRVDEAQLDHFIHFITSPHIIQDLPFGQKKFHLSNGNILEVPNVIRSLIPERIAAQYKQYCEENNFVPFSRSTMLRVLSACSATVRRCLQGLEYFAADSASAFVELIDLLSQILDIASVESVRNGKKS